METLQTRSLRYVEDLGGYTAREDGAIMDFKGNILPVYADGTVFVRPDFHNWRRIPAHRLIAMAFVPNPEDLRYVLFKDGNKRNLEASNLFWSASKNGGGARNKDSRPKDPWGSGVPNKADRIKALAAKGMKAREISVATGATVQYVNKVMKDA